VGGLSAEQRSFRTASDRWSIADCVEHLAIVENNILKSIETHLERPAAPETSTAGKDELILNNVPNRSIRVKGPDAVMPVGRWPDFDDLLREFEAARHRTLGFAETAEADLRAHAFPHPFLGPLDCHQWLLFLATHCERHVRQIEEVKSDPAFPARTGSALA